MNISIFKKRKKYSFENIKIIESDYKGYYSKSFKIFKKNKEAMICLFIIIAIITVAIFAPVFAPYDPNTQSLANMLQSPSAKHIFGTDEFGRDILSRIIYGARISLSVGVVSQGIASIIGFSMGVMAGYFGGKVDRIISFLIQIFSSFPYILFAIALIFVLGPGVFNLFIALGLLSWANIARMIRGQIMQLKKKEYIEACIINGGSSFRVIMKHLLPNCISTMIVLITLGIPNAIINEASLSFLGLGVQAPTSSWGSMISLSQPYIRSNPTYSIIPGIAIILLVLSFNIVGDGLRDALDPKMKS